MHRIIEDGNGYYAVFSYNNYGKFWQQTSKWYCRKCYAEKYKDKLCGA